MMRVIIAHIKCLEIKGDLGFERGVNDVETQKGTSERASGVGWLLV